MRGRGSFLRKNGIKRSWRSGSSRKGWSILEGRGVGWKRRIRWDWWNNADLDKCAKCTHVMECEANYTFLPISFLSCHTPLFSPIQSKHADIVLPSISISHNIRASSLIGSWNQVQSTWNLPPIHLHFKIGISGRRRQDEKERQTKKFNGGKVRWYPSTKPRIWIPTKKNGAFR